MKAFPGVKGKVGEGAGVEGTEILCFLIKTDFLRLLL